MSPTEHALTLLNEAKELLGKEPPAGMYDAYPMYLSSKDIMDIVGCSRNKAVQIMNSPDFPLLRHGKLMRVQRDQFFAYIFRHTNKGA